MSRYRYIDAMKGLGIFFVVMGHSIAWQFRDFSAFEVASNADVLVAWRFIYSFHMPLLMFCSGLVFPRYDALNKLWKRFTTLLIPYFCMGFLLNMVRGGGYWFLLILFEFYLITSFLDYILSHIKIIEHKWIPFILVAGLVWYLSIKLSKYERLPLLDIDHLKLFPYYVFGIMLSRYQLNQLVMNKHVITISMALFPLLFWICWYDVCTIPGWVGKILWILLPIPVITVVNYIMKNNESNSSKWYSTLSYLGKHSLEIYLLHFFFTTKLTFLGDYFIRISEHEYAWTEILILQCTVAFTVSIIVIALCVIVMKVLGHSPFLSQMLLGRKAH